MARIKLELKKLVSVETEIEAGLTRAIGEALENRIPLIEIIFAADSDRVKKHILRFLARPEVKDLFYRVEKGGKNTGRIFIHFRHKNTAAYH